MYILTEILPTRGKMVSVYIFVQEEVRQKCKDIVDWLQTRGLEFYLESHNGNCQYDSIKFYQASLRSLYYASRSLTILASKITFDM